MCQPVAIIHLTDDERGTLEQWTPRGKSEQRLVERAKIILLAHQGRTKQLAEARPGVSKDQVWRILRGHDICLQRRRSWCIGTDPEFGPKAADVVGLYLNPPEQALVIAVDEKPSMQALERAQGYLRLPDGKAVNGSVTATNAMVRPHCLQR